MIRRLALLALLAAPSVHAGAEPGKLALVLQGAHEQVGVTRFYDGSYRRIAFPGGDVPRERGVCSDVVVRAFRNAGVDLQLLINQDMTKSFDAYPKLWGLSRPDPNIDHRRVPNLATFFKRHGSSLAISRDPRDYVPGDIVTWRLPSGVPHLGLVSDRSENGRAFVIHNIGAGAQVEDMLFTFTITGHYRYAP